MPDLVGNPEFMFSHDTAQRYVFFLEIFNDRNVFNFADKNAYLYVCLDSV